MDRNLSAEVQGLLPELAAFQMVAELGHVTRAAQALDAPQSSVSRRIHRLERLLGITLFVPLGRGLQLTAQGQQLLDGVTGPLRALDEAIASSQQDADPDAGLVRFGFPFSLGPVTVPHIVSEFHQQAPGVRFSMKQAHGSELAEDLHAGRLDLALLIPPPPDLRTRVLGTQRVLVQLSSSHPLAGRPQIRLRDLRAEAFIAPPTTYNIRLKLNEWCEDAGFVPRVAYEISEFSTVRALVARGLGVSLLPRAQIAVDGLVEVPLAGKRYFRHIGLSLASTMPSAAVRRFGQYLEGRPELGTQGPSTPS